MFHVAASSASLVTQLTAQLSAACHKHLKVQNTMLLMRTDIYKTLLYIIRNLTFTTIALNEKLNPNPEKMH